MDILLVCSSLGGGGAERVAINIGAFFCDVGHNVSIYYWDDKGDRSYSVDKRIAIHKSPVRNFFSRTLRLRRLLQEKTVDVVIGFTDMPNISVYLSRIGARSSAAFVATIHNDLRLRDSSVHLNWKTRLIRFIHRRACVFADKVVVVSEGAKKSLSDYYNLSESDLVRIYNPIFEMAIVVPMKPNISPPLKLIAAGRLSKQKNYPLMIKAVKILNEKFHVSCRLYIYGEGELRPHIENLISESGMQGTVSLCGFIPDLSEKMSDADVFLLSSSWEGFGNVIAEALSVGLRVVSTDCPSGPREILADGKYGTLVPVEDAESMARAVADLIGTTPDYTADQLQEHLEQFTFQNVGREYLKLIDDVVVRSAR